MASYEPIDREWEERGKKGRPERKVRDMFCLFAHVR